MSQIEASKHRYISRTGPNSNHGLKPMGVPFLGVMNHPWVSVYPVVRKWNPGSETLGVDLDTSRRTVDGCEIHFASPTQKPWLWMIPCTYQQRMFQPRFLRWCELDSVHPQRAHEVWLSACSQQGTCRARSRLASDCWSPKKASVVLVVSL